MATPRARCSRCSIPSRTAPSATTTSTCPSTCRRSCSSRRRTPWTRSPGRCATAWRSSSALRLHRGREARDRRGATSSRGRSSATGSRGAASPSPTPPCGRSSPSTRARPASADWSGEIGDIAARWRGRWRRRTARRGAGARGQGRAGASRARSAARDVLTRDRPKRRTRRAGVATGPGLDAGRRRRALHRGDGDSRARGRLTLTGQLGDVMRESAQAALSYVRAHASTVRPAWPGTGSRRTICTSTSRPGRSPRTGRAPASRWPPRSPRSSPGAASAPTWP